MYAYQASMNVGELAYYPVDPKNVSANTVIFEYILCVK